MSAWTPERVNKLLLLIIQRHVTGTPDYHYLAAELGCTYDAVRLRWGFIRRELGIAPNRVATSVSAQKKQPKFRDDVKMENELDREINVVFQDPTPPPTPKKRKAEHVKVESEMHERLIKKVRTERGAATKAATGIKKNYENPWEGYIE